MKRKSNKEITFFFLKKYYSFIYLVTLNLSDGVLYNKIYIKNKI